MSRAKGGGDRRAFLMAAPVLAAAATEAAAQAPAIQTPKLDLAVTIHVTIGPTRQIGPIPAGTARVIPITGGTFEGRGMKGKVMPGGADWQITRPDGVTELRAHYGLETDDGKIIQVHNHCLMVPQTGGQPLIRSTLTFEAPAPHDWMNKAVFVGTLNAPGDSQAPVVIRAFQAS
jgi:hypothetical protein